MLIAGFNPHDIDKYSKLNPLHEWFEFVIRKPQL